MKLKLKSSFKPLLVSLKVFGLFPFCVDEHKIQYSYFWVAWTVFINFTTIFGIIKLCLSKENFSRTALEVWRSITLVQNVLVLIQSLYQIKSSNKLIDFISSIQNFDDKVSRNGIFFDYKRIRMEVFILIISLILKFIYQVSLLTIFYFFLVYLNFYEVHICNGYQMMYLHLHTIQFYILCRTIKKRFEKVNDYLEFYFRSLHFSQHKKIVSTKILKFFEMHHELCKILKRFNEIVTFNITPSLIHILLQTILITHEIMIMIFKENSKLTQFWVHLACSITWMIWQIGLLMIFCHSGSSLTYSAEASEEILLDKLTEIRNFDYSELILHNFFMRLKSEDKTVKNQFIAINWKLFLMVISKILDLNS